MNSHQKEIYQYLLDGIATGRLPLNGRIPTECELGEQFHTNRLNAHYAVKKLEQSGLLCRNKKQGTFVKMLPPPFQLRALRSVVSRRVCVLNLRAPQVSHIHWNDRIISPLETRLRSKGIDVECIDIQGIKSKDAYQQVLEGLMDVGCNALILVADGSGAGIAFECPELLYEFQRNVVVFDPGQVIWQSMPYNVVTVNLFGEGLAAADYLISKGYQEIFFCKRRSFDRIWLRERLRGVECTFRRSGIDGAPRLVEFDAKGSNNGFFNELKTSGGDGTAAVIAMNDELAAEIMDEAAGHGIQFGKDVGLVSFDDNSEFRSCSLTTVAPALERIGEELARIVIDCVEGESDGQITCVKVDSTIIARQTA